MSFHTAAAAASDSSTRHSVHVLFLQPAPPNDPQEYFLNRLTSYIGAKVHGKGKGFHHVEMVVPDYWSNTGGFLSSSIYNGETVTLTKTKTFANPAYTILSFSVNSAELSSMLDYLYESKRQELKFDQLGMFLAVLPFQVGWRSRSKTFCSKHITKALKAANIESVMHLNENIVTPSKLYKVLHTGIPADRKVAGSVQYKESSMLSHPNLQFSIK